MSTSRRDRILAGHVGLAAAMAVWRVVEGTPGLSSAGGEGVLATLPGQVLLAAVLLAAVAVLVAVAWLTARELGDARVVVLGVLLALSLARRSTFDAFDLLYLLAVPIAAATGLRRGRAGEALPASRRVA